MKQWIYFDVFLGIPQLVWLEIEHCTIRMFQMFATYLNDEAKKMNGCQYKPGATVEFLSTAKISL